jgi:hypothetical protein
MRIYFGGAMGNVFLWGGSKSLGRGKPRATRFSVSPNILVFSPNKYACKLRVMFSDLKNNKTKLKKAKLDK